MEELAQEAAFRKGSNIAQSIKLKLSERIGKSLSMKVQKMYNVTKPVNRCNRCMFYTTVAVRYFFIVIYYYIVPFSVIIGNYLWAFYSPSTIVVHYGLEMYEGEGPARRLLK